MSLNSKLMFVGLLLSFLFVLGLVCVEKTQAQNTSIFIFTKNLKLGDNSSDVKQLQVFLNKDPDTRIAAFGVGSAGNETTYFGNMTKLAVMRFQTKYRQEILDVSGLTSPTGFFGQASINKMNTLLLLSTVSSNDENVNQNLLPPANISMPVISDVSKVSVASGETLTITGDFSGKSIVHFDDTAILDAKIISSKQINVTVPNKSGISLVWVSNEYGDSRADFPMFVLIGVPVTERINKLTAQNNIIHNKAIDPLNQ